MNNYRYILEPYKGMSSRNTCPNCNKRKVFSKYIDSNTGEHLPDKYGKCERSDKCSYHLSPYKDGYSQRIWEQESGEYKANWKPSQPQHKPQPPVKQISFIPVDPFKQSLKGYEANNFVKYLIEFFGNEITAGLISRYFIGTSKHWPGATIFWQIDITGKIRTGKIMQYSPTKGKRTKEPFNHIAWVHKALKQDEFELKQCFFGEHLLKGNAKPVAIVESEKTAIIASVYFPQFVWIAAGNLNGLNVEKCQVLSSRQIILYPDLSKPQPGKPTAFEKWSAKAKDLATIANFTVNDLLERKAGEAQRIEGGDLADYLIKFNHKEFTESIKIENETILLSTESCGKLQRFEIQKLDPLQLPARKVKFCEVPKKAHTTWSHEVNELEKYFSIVTIPARPIKLYPCNTINSVPQFIESHLATLKNYDGNKKFLPFLNRLQDLKHLLNINNY